MVLIVDILCPTTTATITIMPILPGVS